MAKPSIVSRTITSTKVNAFCANPITRDSYNKDFIVPGTFKDKDKLLKSCQKIHQTDEEKIIFIHSAEVITELRGMSESDFIKYSEILPPRGTKKTDTTVTE